MTSAAVALSLVLGTAACGGVSGEVEASGLSLPPTTQSEAPVTDIPVLGPEGTQAPEPSAPPETEPAPPTTRASAAKEETLIEGDRICADETAPLGNIRTSMQMKGRVEQIRFLEQGLRTMARRLRALPIPAVDRDELALAFALIDQAADGFASLEVGIQDRDQAAATAAVERITVILDDVHRRMGAYGFEDCAEI